MTDQAQRHRVFLDISHSTTPLGRLTFELYADKAPRTCDNFRQLCTGQRSSPLSYKSSPFHRVIDEFMVQGGDITLGNGRGGESIYGGEFADENLNWRDLDDKGLLCMANHGKDTNSSQFFITLDECPHLNGKHTVFGRLVAGQETLHRIAKVPVDKDDRPLEDVIITNCGELERKNKTKTTTNVDTSTNTNKKLLEETDHSMNSSTSRGRHKRRLSASLSRSRSPSPSRGHGRESGSRHRHRHRRPKRSTSRSQSCTPPTQDRRRSEQHPDHTFRGRMRHRLRSRSRSRGDENGSRDATPKGGRKRSPPPSRQRSRDEEMRRQRSLPNQYRREDRHMQDVGYGRLGGARGENGRLGGGGGGGGGGGESTTGGGVVYKGRGAMKFREQRKKW